MPPHHPLAPLSLDIRPRVPHAKRVVHRVGQQHCAVWRHLEPRDGVRVPAPLVPCLVRHLQIPSLYLIVKPPRKHAQPIVRKLNSRHLVLIREGHSRPSLPRVPHKDHAIIRPAARQVVAVARGAHRVDEGGVPHHLLEALARLHIPQHHRLVRRARPQVLVVDAVLDLQDRGLVALEDCVVGALAVDLPQKDVLVVPRRRAVLPRRVELERQHLSAVALEHHDRSEHGRGPLGPHGHERI
mmetsp:Transcript_9271/g.17984  ORF Transcript_9271/g.17984 Transcript_9271/m.17984 type:complete len:241 (-) Transcript_9271:113-835(-)